MSGPTYEDLDKHCPTCSCDSDTLLVAARAVLDNWESGDLAQAVRQLAAAVAETEGSV